MADESIIHIQHGSSSYVAWKNLEAIYEDKSQETAVAIIRNLWHTTAEEDDDISEHLTTLKKYWERLNLVDDSNFKIPEVQFKIAIVSSLPPSWDNFTRPYISIRKGDSLDPKLMATSQELIGVLKEEYVHRQRRTGKLSKDEVAHQTCTGKPSLLGRMNNTEHCGHCGKQNHETKDCRFLGQSKCGICNRFGHGSGECYSKKAKDLKRKREKDEGKGKAKKKKKKEEMNQGEEIDEDDEQDHVAFSLNESSEIPMDESEEGQFFNFDEPIVYDSTEYNPRLIYYDWLGDSATTSHVSNRREAFKTFQPLTDTTVSGVGNVKAEAKGRGTVELKSSYEGHDYILELKNVLYIPTNRNNLISLGRWDKAGGQYRGGGGALILITKDGTPVARGTQIGNNLYKMNVNIREPGAKTTKEEIPQSFVINEPSQNWETWHKRFGHIGYSGLQYMLDKNLVKGFNVDINSPKPDCIACTEAKQSVEPFDEPSQRETEPGDLTHIDLWGKYDTTSINGNRYFLLMVDDSTRFITTEFIKEKKEAAQKVKNYLIKLISHNKKPKAIRLDRGKEFLNVTAWCQEQGIEIQMTAPYSPSQNGVAERMNRTLVEIARAMIRGLPEFLWEYAIAHASYLRNRAYTKSLKGQTPYEKWFKNKPNISHLREFGAPVWVLLQGQKQPRKMETKSRRRIFVSYDDGSKSIKYYNAETRKVLISRNIRFLALTNDQPPSEPIVVLPDAPDEGESKGSMPPTSGNSGNNLKRKRDEEEEPNQRETRVKPRINYRYLNDPFPDEEEDEATFISDDYTFAIIAGDEYTSLKDARNSPDWPEWEKAIQNELAQLYQTGTWKLVEKPPNAIPIANKWTFIRKRNKAGEIVKYKARLVAKGCAQRPGYDYVETFSPVIRMDTIRAILALVPILGLKIHQLDIKGAYLNGILKEKVYMRQPEGYEDDTDRICELLKTLYGLKQSGREWNIEFDKKMKEFGFNRISSDPCVYIKQDGNDVVILTVWVDDILLFATSDKLIEQTISDLKSVWEVTDVGEPTKIVGIEITQNNDSITISQKLYIKSILEREGLTGINSVTTPLDPNIKLEPNPDGNEGNRSNSFARLLGELQFLANSTRPDIAFAVNRLASYTANPSMQHFAALKRILRYLAGTTDLGITYSKNAANLSDNSFYGFADAAYANHDDHKSTSGYVFLASGGAITWKSKKQTTIALSSTEAEYVALSEAAREACWLRNLYNELGVLQKFPIVIKGDNDGSIAMAKNQQFHNRSKHIAIRWHWVRDLVEEKLIDIKTCRDPQQTADVLTKALPRPKHCRHIFEMGIAST